MHVTQVKHTLISDDVYRRLRDAIFSGELASAQRLDIKRLAEEFGVSNHPVNEALNRLALEGLVTVKPRSGTFIRTLTLPDIHHILDARLMIETFAVSSISDPSPDSLAVLAEKAAVLSGVANEEPFRFGAYNEADIGFHETLVELSGNPELLRLYRSLHAHFVTARAYFGRALEKAIANEDDHRDIYLAIVRRDYGRARNLVLRHITDAKEGVLGIVQNAGVRL